MMIRRTLVLSLALFSILSSPAGLLAQGTQADYERASHLAELTRGKVFRARVEPHWLSDNRRFWYRVDLPDNKRQFLLVDAETGEKQPGLRSRAFGRGLSEGHRATVRRSAAAVRLDQDRRGVERRPVSRSRQGLVVFAGVLRDFGGRCGEPAGATRSTRTRRRSFEQAHPDLDSPDGKWTVVIKDFQLWLRNRETNEESVLAADGSPDHFYEEQVFWSPDSTRLVALKTKRGGDRKVFLIESSPQDQLQPKLDSYDYLKPGDEIPLTTPCLFRVADRQPIEISNSLFPQSVECERGAVGAGLEAIHVPLQPARPPGAADHCRGCRDGRDQCDRR